MRTGGTGAPSGGRTFGYFLAVPEEVAPPVAPLVAAASALLVGEGRWGVGSQWASTSVRWHTQPRAKIASAMRAMKNRPSAPSAWMDQPSSSLSQPKSASPNVVFAEPKEPRTLRRNAGRKVIMRPLAKAPSAASWRPLAALLQADPRPSGLSLSLAGEAVGLIRLVLV